MSDSNHPSVARDIYFIHLVITRALNVAIEYCQSLQGKTIADFSIDPGFLNYVQSFVTLLDSHHLVEDEVIFPYFQNKLSEVPFDVMNIQHQSMLPVLEQINLAINNLTTEVANLESLNVLEKSLIKMRDIWEPHFQLEELYLNEENISKIIDDEEQIRLTKLFAEEGKKHIAPDYLLIPFILYNLSPENRAVISQAFPPFVIEKVTTSEWRDKWQTMSPFLV